MNNTIGRREQRRYPRFFLELPLEYRSIEDLLSWGGLIVNISEEGIRFESPKSIPVNTRLEIAILFPDGFELNDFRLVTRVIWKEPLFKENWEGYQYGLKIIQILDKDLGKQALILKGRLGIGRDGNIEGSDQE